jgi:outer membrane protein W
MNDNWFAELGLGAIGKVEARNNYFSDANVHVSAMNPLCFGLRYELFSIDNRSAFQPYITGGAGPYWISDILVKENNFGEDEQVSAKTDLLKGGYAGAGLNFALTSWLNFGLDARYHFVNFDKKHERSGWEYGFGLTFMWGRYQPD